MTKKTEFFNKYYGFLKGKVILEAGCAGEWPYFIVQDPESKEQFKIEVSRDPEGNGPGFLFGLPRPETTK